MKKCHVCNSDHASNYCHYCGAFSYMLNGSKQAVNRYGIPMAAAIGKVSIVMRYARKIQNNIPVGVSRVMSGSSSLRA